MTRRPMTPHHATAIVTGIERDFILPAAMMTPDGQVIEALVSRGDARLAARILRLAGWSADRISTAFASSGWTHDGSRR